MAKIKLSDQEIERLAYAVVQKNTAAEELEGSCKSILEAYLQAKDFFLAIKGEKTENIAEFSLKKQDRNKEKEKKNK